MGPERWRLGSLPQLDGLRAVAVVLVVVYHAVRHGGAALVPGTFLGVDVFFVLSGFLITSLLLQQVREKGSLDLLGFYRRRFWRLYPALVLLCVVLLALAPFSTRDTPRHVVLGVVFALTYLASWAFAYDWPNGPLGHAWSLSVEEHFYLVWPVVLLVLLRRRRPLLWVTGTAVVAAAWPLVYQLVAHPTANRLYAGPDTRSAQLLVGALLATALAEPATERLVRRLSGAPALWAALAVLGLGAATLHRKGAPYLLGGQVVVSLAVAVVVAHLVLQVDWTTRLLGLQPLVAVGRWSYGIYLWHLPTIFVGYELVGVSLPVRVLGAAVAFPIAWASYRWVEQPLLRRYGGRPDGAAAVPEQRAPAPEPAPAR